jgi:hypothetical protein
VRPSTLGLVAAITAALILLFGLGDHGVWTEGELPVLDRSRAALGTALTGLQRSPWLPDTIRTQAYAALGPLGLRLPHALSVAALVGIATGLQRSRGASPVIAVLTGALALAFPVAIHSGRLALGNPIGELLGVLFVLAAHGALAAGRLRLVLAPLAAIALSLAIASLGLLLGGALPLAVFAASLPRSTDRRIRAATWIAAAALLATTVWLSVHQGDGYIPLLGASKDLDLVAKPEDRRFAAGLQEAGYQLFPWLPLVLLGALATDRDRFPAQWLLLGVAAVAGHSLVYGTTAAPVIVPAAMCGAAAIERLSDPKAPGAWRRVVIAGSLLGVLVLGKDVELAPSEIAAPLVGFQGEHTFPGTELLERVSLSQLSRTALLSLLVAGIVCTRRGRLGAALDRIPPHARAVLPAVIVGIAALHGAWVQAHRVVPTLSQLLSPAATLARWQGFVDTGALAPVLGEHRLRDPGMDAYGPETTQKLVARRDVEEFLAASEPRAVLLRARDVPPVFQKLRERGIATYVLDARHQTLRLVSNALPDGAVDENPIPTVLFTEPPQLAHPTLLRFGNFVEIIGWEVTTPIVRGREVTLRLAIRVLRPLPAGAKVYTRFLKGKTSRLNGDPQALTLDVYPPNLWREGDYILHEQTFEAPWLEIQPGPHEFFVGLRKSEHENFEISLPEGQTGEHGVRVRGKTRNFATLGEVEVW